MSDLQTLLLTEQQQQLYQAALARKGLSTRNQQGITRRDPRARLPLSSFQEPLWFIDEYMVGDSAHDVVYPMGLPAGAIDESALRRAIERMFQRHEILRTTFELDGESPVQIVHQHVPVSIEKVDLSALPQEKREPAGWKLVEQQAQRVFDLATAPLIVFTLLKVEPAKAVLIVTLHHIICDTWSMSIIDREVRTHYDDIVNGRPWSLPEPEIQFGDYVLWQRLQCENGSYREDLGYWTDRLKDAQVLQLPTDRPIQEHRNYAADNQLVLIDAALLRKIKLFAKEQGVTLYMVLLTAYQIMLQRHTGQHDIVVGTPHANREVDAIKSMIGFTINSLVMRGDLSGNPSFAELTRRIKQTALEAYEHHNVPFQLLVEELGPDVKGHGLSRHFLLRAFFSVQNIQWSEEGPAVINTGELHSRPRFTVPHPTTKYDLYMYLRERDDMVLGGLEYDRELFDSGRIARMVSHFVSVLEQGVERSQVGIQQLQILSTDENRKVRLTWNDTQQGGVFRGDLVSRFREAAAQHAAVIAVESGASMSFAQLEARSNQLANGLRSLGVQREENIGLIADRTLEMPAAVLGILKAGASCVPLDPALPAERIAQLLRTSDISKVLCDPSRTDSRAYDVQMISLQEDFAACAETAPDVAINPLQSAFVFFTSGSTGTPNAVVLTHGGVLSAQLPDRCAHPMVAGSRLLMTTPVGSARLPGELLWPLLAGASVVLASPGGHQDTAYVAEALKNERITHISVTPQLLTQLVAERAFTECPTLQWVYCVGDYLEGNLAARFQQQSRATLCNSYAQTEVCPVAFTSSEPFTSQRIVPVGKVAPNTQVYLLDGFLEMAPIGVTAGIYVGGANLSRGYLNNARLTAEMFVPSPFGGAGERLYRTGDLGRWDEQGNLSLAGRRDQRIKIMSYRVDLGEIERTLMDLDGVKKAVVLAAGKEHKHTAIIAFVQIAAVPAQPSKMSAVLRKWMPGKPLKQQVPVARQLQTTLQRKLPFYMVPSRIYLVEEFPLGVTGKVDRNKLLEIAQEPSDAISTEDLPENPDEQVLASIWEEVLGLSENSVGIHASFFELGGQSLMAAKIVKRIRTRLGVTLHIRDIFESATIAGLADLIEATRESRSLNDADEAH